MTLTPEQIDELKETFAYNDSDDDGRIEFGEFVDLLDELEAGVSFEEAQIGFNEIDLDDDGVVDFDEFVDWWRGR